MAIKQKIEILLRCFLLPAVPFRPTAVVPQNATSEGIMESLQVTDQQAAAVAKAPRVTLDDISSNIAAEYTFTASKAISGCPGEDDQDMNILTMCLLKMKNGFIVIGKSAPASPENFNAELGAKFAREDAIRQLWPIMGYALREKLTA